MVTENLDMYGIIFRLIGSFLEHIEHLSVTPFGKMIVLGFGSVLVFIRNNLIPKRLRLKKSSGKKYK